MPTPPREPLTISHTSLYHALAEAADHFGTESAFNVAAVRRPGLSGLPGKWELTVTPVAEKES